jgi:hypothetical protein
MIKRWSMWLIAAVATVQVTAHHSFSAFDMEKEVSIEGVVYSYQWMNPHAQLTLKVPTGAKDPAQVGTWDIARPRAASRQELLQ